MKVSAAVREDTLRPQMGLNAILGPFWIIVQKPGPDSKNFCIIFGPWIGENYPKKRASYSTFITVGVVRLSSKTRFGPKPKNWVPNQN